MYYTQVWCFKKSQTFDQWTLIYIYEDQTWLNNYQAGGLDLLKAKWKKLSEYATNTLTAVNLGNIKTFQLSGMSALNVTVRTSLPSWKNTRYKIGPLKLCWDVRVFMSIVFFVIFFYVIVGALGALPEHPLLWIWHSTVELRQRSTEDGRRALWGSEPQIVILLKFVQNKNILQVIGLTTYQLPLLQAGGTGHCFAQCRSCH